MKGAKGVLINITGGMDLTLFEVDEAANRIRSEVDPEANIIVGSTFNEELEGTMRVSVVATGILAEEDIQDDPQLQSNVAVLKRPTTPAWRGRGGGAPVQGSVSAVGNAAVAPQEQIATEPKAELQQPVQEAPLQQAPTQEVIKPQPSPAADLIRQASDFAQAKERKPLTQAPETRVAAPIEEQPVQETQLRLRPILMSLWKRSRIVRPGHGESEAVFLTG